jgi:hypothetical protein
VAFGMEKGRAISAIPVKMIGLFSMVLNNSSLSGRTSDHRKVRLTCVGSDTYVK